MNRARERSHTANTGDDTGRLDVDDGEGTRGIQWSSRRVVYEYVSEMMPSCSVRWVSPTLIDSFSVQFVVSAPKARQATSKLLGQRLHFAFAPGEYARALPDMRAKQAYLRELKETSEGAYIRYEWPQGFAEYVLFVKPVRLPDSNLIYGMQAQDQQPVNPLFHLPMIGSQRPEINTSHSTYSLTLEKLRSLSSGEPTRFVEPLARAYDARFPKFAKADWNVLTNFEGVIIAAARPYGEAWRKAIYQYGTRALIGHPPAHWPTVLSVLEGKTVLSLRSGVNADDVIEQERHTPQPTRRARLYTSCYTGPCSFMLAEREGFIFCFVDDDELLITPAPNRYLSLADWIGLGHAVLTPTQVEAREILRRRRLSKDEQVDLPVVETFASIPHSGSQETRSQRFAQIIADHVGGRVAQEVLM